MTWAPCFAASSMYLRCFSTIESLSPVHATWTRAAFTFAICCPLCEGARLTRPRGEPLLALAELAHLVAATAGIHVAPAATVVLRTIEEQPRAGVVGALAQQR